MRFKHKQILTISLAILVIICMSAFFYRAYAPTGDIIMIRSGSGGLCAGSTENPHACYTEAKLYSNGSFGKQHLTKQQVARLRSLINQTDFSQYGPKNTTLPLCPSATDGTNVGYAFPEKTGSTVYIVCKLHIPIDDPLFTYLDSLK